MCFSRGIAARKHRKIAQIINKSPKNMYLSPSRNIDSELPTQPKGGRKHYSDHCGHLCL